MKQYKFIKYDKNGNITDLIKASEKVFLLNNKDNQPYIKVDRNINVDLQSKVTQGQLNGED